MTKITRTVSALCVSAFLAFSANAIAGMPIDRSELPEAVVTALNTQFPGHTILKTEMEKENEQSYYEVELCHEQNLYEVDVTAEGTILEVDHDGACSN